MAWEVNSSLKSQTSKRLLEARLFQNFIGRVSAFGTRNNDCLARANVHPLFVTAFATFAFRPSRSAEQFRHVAAIVFRQSRHRESAVRLNVE